MSPLAWVVLAAALCAGEVVTLDLVLLMLGAGALAAAGTALVTGALVPQLVVFAVTSVLLLAVVRPVARRHLEVPALPAGKDRLIGRRVLVVEPVAADSGQVRLDGELWRARAAPGGPALASGSPAFVASVEGATLHVYPEEPA